MKFATLVLCFLVCVIASPAQVLDARKLGGSKVRYVSPEKLREYPTPVLSYLNDREESEKHKDEIIRKIIYPFLNKHERPVASIVVDFCPVIVVTGANNERGCEYKDKLTVSVSVKEQGGLGFQAFFDIGADGRIDNNAYLIFFEEGYTKTPQ